MTLAHVQVGGYTRTLTSFHLQRISHIAPNRELQLTTPMDLQTSAIRSQAPCTEELFNWK